MGQPADSWKTLRATAKELAQPADIPIVPRRLATSITAPPPASADLPSQLNLREQDEDIAEIGKYSLAFQNIPTFSEQ
jgi:hypothetical protein